MDLDLATVRTVYLEAISPRPNDEGDADWWAAVAAELNAVIDAPTIAPAASVISWWHRDWSAVGDTAEHAAQRLRSAAAHAALKH